MSFKIDILVLSIIGLNFTPKILENIVECNHARIHTYNKGFKMCNTILM